MSIARLISTWFGVGLLPKAPGTWGSLAALPFAWFIYSYGGYQFLLLATAGIFAAGVWLSGIAAAESGAQDPGEVVIDEVAGQWLTLVVVPPDFLLYAAGFVLFRIFDIWKPWPVSWADRNLKGGLGIMLDDILAGVYAAVILFALKTWLETL